MKTIEEIYGEMLHLFQTETGLEPGGTGDMAVRLRAVAAQIYALYVQSGWVERQCFPQTAQGEYLDRHAQLRGLERRAAAAAQGILRFVAGSAAGADLNIPAGTVCMTAGLVRFETVEEGLLPAGETAVEVGARALEPGAAGNVGAGSIRAMAVSPVGISQCENRAAFSGGSDREDDEGLRVRVLETFRRMPNGANAAFYHQGAMSFPEVAAAAVLPRSRGIGTVDVVVATPGGLPDGILLGQLQAYFEARREIAVDVLVKAPEVKTVNVAVAVDTSDGRDPQVVLGAARAALERWFDGSRLGRNVLRARLGEVLLQVDGVENYRITAPTEDVAVAAAELPKLGTLTVSAMEANA